MFDYIALQTEVDRCELRLHTSEFLYREGEKAHYVYCIKEGKLVVYRQHEQTKNVLISFVKAGDVLGLSALTKGIHKHSVKTLGDTLVTCIPRHIIMENVQKEFDFKLAVMQNICKEANAMDKKSLLIRNKDTKQQIAIAILDMINVFGMDVHQWINLQYPIEGLADFLGLSPRNFNRALNDLSAYGFIELNKRGIRVLDEEGIRMLTQ